MADDGSFQNRWPEYDRAISGGGAFNPAVGLTLIQRPEAIIPHLIAKGVPPPKDIPEGVDHIDAGQSLGRALGFSTDTPWGRINAAAQNAPVITGAAPSTFVPGKTVGDVSPESPRVGPTKDQTRVAATPTQQGAVEIPERKPAPPTPAPEQTAATGERPEGNTALQPPEPKEKETKSGQSGLDSLGMALAGVRALPTPTPQHIFSPQAPRPTNQISRSNAPQILMQELMAAARPGAALRLGQALQGK